MGVQLMTAVIVVFCIEGLRRGVMMMVVPVVVLVVMDPHQAGKVDGGEKNHQGPS